jgi:predicted lipid-binding transport protein (Tim44 family)
MFDPSFYPNSPLLGSQSPQSPHSRHAILLAAYKAKRRERLALERTAARAANRSAWRKFAAALGTLAARLVVGTCRSMLTMGGFSRSDCERRSGLAVGD